MSVYARIQRIILRTLGIVAGTAVVALGILVLSRLLVHTTPAEAASVIYYPNFCLGGWKYPQHASGPAAVTGNFDPDKFNTQNSSYLESSVASQLFCGYFSVKNSKNPPTKAVISFNWLFAFKDGSVTKDPEDSFTSTSTDSVGISPATGFVVSTTTVTNTVTTPATTTQPAQIQQNNFPASNPPVSNPQSNATPTNPNTAAVGDTNTSSGSSSPSTTTEIPVIHDTVAPTTLAPTAPASNNPTPDSANGNASTPASDSGTPPPPTSTPETTPTSSTPPPPAPVQESAPAPAPTPAPAPVSAPEPAPSGDAPQSFNSSQSVGSFIASLIAEKVHAQEVADTDTIVQSPLNGNTFKDFLEVSYSLDGIRWTAIGRVNKDNWKNYSVAIPVTSWDEVKRLQIMVSVLPTIDEKPDIYLDSMSMRAEYSQTVAELAAQGFAAVSNAVDSLIGDGNDAENAYNIIPEAKKGPQPVEIRTKKLSFPSVGGALTVSHDTYDSEGRVVGKVSSKKITVSSGDGGASLNVTGSCDKKYSVILTYREKDDYRRKPRSFIVNRAQECVSGNFSFNLASLSPETRDGSQYLVVGEQGEEGTWDVTSDVFPITIEATTTVQIINQ